MPRYVKCPRCDLNYIDADTQEYCDICMAELGSKHRFIDVDDEELTDYDYVPDSNAVCSMCGKVIPAGETMCEACKEKYGIGDEQESGEPAESEEGTDEEDDEWKSYLDDAEVELSDEEKSLKEELEAEYGDEEEYDDEEEEEEEEEEGYTMNLEDFDDDDGEYSDDFDDDEDLDDEDFDDGDDRDF